MMWFNVICLFWKTLPLELLWLGPTFYLIGGGTGVLNAILMSILTDVLPESNR
jgi:hypothetical protein